MSEETTETVNIEPTVTEPAPTETATAPYVEVSEPLIEKDFVPRMSTFETTELTPADVSEVPWPVALDEFKAEIFRRFGQSADIQSKTEAAFQHLRHLK